MPDPLVPPGPGASSHSELARAELEVLERQNDPVFGIDEGGVVLYANPTVSRLLGLPVEQIEGRSIVDFVHPEDLARAAEVVAELRSDRDIGVGVTPAIYRVRCADGSWLPLEITGSTPIEEGTFAGWMVMMGRYSGDYDLHLRISEQLTSGASFDELVELVPEFGHWRHPGEPYLVLCSGQLGRPLAAGSTIAARLAREHTGPETPWALAASTGEVVQRTVAELPPALARAAVDHELAGCIAEAVPDPSGAPSAVLVAWSTAGGPALTIHRYPIEQMRRALVLIMQWRHHIAQLEYAARYDALTGLTNRATFLRRLAAEEVSEPDALVAVLYVDLDDFKHVNDRFGHQIGDELLVEAARRMSLAIRSRDVVARLGGDEFAVLCPDVRHLDEATAVADRIVAALQAPVRSGALELEVGVSIGVAMVTLGSADATEALERADSAMYRAKASGKNRWCLATHE